MVEHATMGIVSIGEFKWSLRQWCKDILISEAVKNTEIDESSPLKAEWNVMSSTDLVPRFTPPAPPPGALTGLLKMPKRYQSKLSEIIKSDNKQRTKIINAHIRKLRSGYVVKKPVTYSKLAVLTRKAGISEKMIAALAIETMARKYFGGAMKKFVEKTFKNNFFNAGGGPYKPFDRTGILWDTEFKNLMLVSREEYGNVVKEPTVKLKHIMQFCQTIIEGAYGDLEVPPGCAFANEFEAFIDRVKRFAGFAEIVNNISATPMYNSSSLILHFYQTVSRINFTFEDLVKELSDLDAGERDVEKALLRYELGRLDYANSIDSDKIADDAYNVVALAGNPYEQIRPALKCEFLLLKLIFWLATRSTQTSLYNFVMRTYKSKFVKFAKINNVLQIFPGLLTIMFYTLKNSAICNNRCHGDKVKKLNHSLILATEMKTAGGAHAAIDRHKDVSNDTINVVTEFIAIIKTQRAWENVEFQKSINEMFLRSSCMTQVVNPIVYVAI
ncbi:hypothetical protein EGW08_020745 [Elysia chlorotica]|uniref:Uncharacterized protein n=1 Tax=Elysia chlorotica TaxID=188477 RepID=A0A433SQS3_ELYCH|nr:hypothetical protein EGW08_020745 [Elysia chlorotica]